MAEEVCVLLPLKPGEPSPDLLRLMRAILPPHRTLLRRLYVQEPVHTGPVFPGVPYEGIENLEFEAENATRFETLQEMKEFEEAGFRIDSEVERGSPRQAVVRETAAWPADLVVVRTGGEGDRRIGWLASALLSDATCGVLTYRNVPEGYRVRRVLLPTDFSEQSRQGIEWGGAIAEITGAEPRLLHVQTPDEGPPLTQPREVSRMAAAQLEEWKKGVNLVLTRPVVRTVVAKAESAAEGIVLTARQERCDLIVLASTGASLLHDLLLGSTARQLVHRSPCPVLVIPKGNRVKVESLLQKAWRLEKEEARGSTPAAPKKPRLRDSPSRKGPSIGTA